MNNVHSARHLFQLLRESDFKDKDIRRKLERYSDMSAVISCIEEIERLEAKVEKMRLKGDGLRQLACQFEYVSKMSPLDRSEDRRYDYREMVDLLQEIESNHPKDWREHF